MIRLALPAGDLQGETARVLERTGLPIGEYAAGSRTYRFALEGREEVRVRVFREKDIPIQIALGNYDLGICGLAWAQELLCRYPYEAVVLLADLAMRRAGLFLAAAAEGSPWRTANAGGGPRIVSEYPNLAEALAMGLRLSAYRVLPVWGAAEAYPPEDAELALLTSPDEATLRTWGLRPLHRVLETSAWVIANRSSLAEKDLTPVLGPLLAEGGGEASPGLSTPQRLAAELPEPSSSQRDVVRLALPDGHQQPHAVAALAAAGLRFPRYDEGSAVRRVSSTVDGLEAKVIRPQDMPQQVALGSFDLAITGRDWLLDHLRCFPSSPVQEVADLGRGRFCIVATVDEELPAGTLAEALACSQARGRRVVRVASEYVNVADHYAREHHMGHYRVIPVSGASEGFVPEDADILIEGTETGRSLAANRLKAIDRLFESTTCLIAARRSVEGRRRELIDRGIASLQKAAMNAPAVARER